MTNPRDTYRSFLVQNSDFCGPFELPEIKTSNLIPEKIVTFSKAMSKSWNKFDYWIIFYENDKNFERLWNNPKLKNTIKEMYRPGAKIGDGGLTDAIRYEIKTGKFVGGKSHIQKGKERLKNLEGISRRESLTKQERKILEDLIKDLKKALGGK